MKRVFIILLLVINFAFCQDKQPKINRNEIKLNVFGFGMWRVVDLSYEYILNKNLAIGSGIAIATDDDLIDYWNIPAFAFRPFFKYYFFDNKYGEGFFMKFVGNLLYYSKDNYGRPFRIGPGAFFGCKRRLEDLIIIELDVGFDFIIPTNKKYQPPNFSSIIGISMGVAF